VNQTLDDIRVQSLAHRLWEGWQEYSSNFTWCPDPVVGRMHRDWVERWCSDNEASCGLCALLLLTENVGQAQVVITNWLGVLHSFTAGCNLAEMTQLCATVNVGYIGARPVIMGRYAEGHDSIEWRELGGTSVNPYGPGRGLVLVNRGEKWHWLPYTHVVNNVWVRALDIGSSVFRSFPHVGPYPPPQGVVWGMTIGGERHLSLGAEVRDLRAGGIRGAYARRTFHQANPDFVLGFNVENLRLYGETPVAWYTPISYRGRKMQQEPSSYITHSEDGSVSGVAFDYISGVTVDKRLCVLITEGTETVGDFVYQYAWLRVKADTSLLNPYKLLGCGDRSDLASALRRGVGYRMNNEVQVHHVDCPVNNTVNGGDEIQRKIMLAMLRAGAPLEQQAMYNLAMPTAPSPELVRSAEETAHAIRQMAEKSRRIMLTHGKGNNLEWDIQRPTVDKCCRSCGRPQLAKFRWEKRLCAECTFGYCTVLGYQIRMRLTTPPGYPGIVTILTINPRLKAIKSDPTFRKAIAKQDDGTNWSGVRLP